MKYMVIKSPRDIQIKDAEMPIINKGTALLKLLYGGICGSDLSSYRGSFAYITYPRIPGHEFSAEIIEVGKNKYGLKKGMIVTCNPYFNCGNCYSCKRGIVNCCTDNQTMGVQRDGAFSEYITMPLERIYDGKGIPAKTLALIEPFSISLHGIKRAGVKKGENVLVIGAGTIGILAGLIAKSIGAHVTICDIASQKLALAQKAGIDDILLNDDPSTFNSKIEKATSGCGFDTTIEAVGLPSTFQNCIDAAAFAGRVILIGVANETLDFYYTIIQKKELSVFGSRNATKADFIEAINIVKTGTINLDKIVTNVFPFEEAQKAFKTFDAHTGEMLKVLFEFGRLN